MKRKLCRAIPSRKIITDNTIEIATSLGCRVVNLNWEGFGNTKNKALALAKYDWVLFLDADEAIDTALLNFLLKFSPDEFWASVKITIISGVIYLLFISVALVLVYRERQRVRLDSFP